MKLVRSTIIVSLASLFFASGCATQKPPVQVEREYIFDAKQSPVAAFREEVVPTPNATEDVKVSVGTRTQVKQQDPVQSLQSNAHGTCGWVLVATGERFPSQKAAQAFADMRELADRRVGEVCAPSGRDDRMKVDNAALRPMGEPPVLRAD